MYMRNTIFLNSELPSRLRPVLSVKLRQVRGIVSAVVEEKKVTVYYMGRLDLRALHLFVRAFEEKYGRKKEAKNDDMDVATYRREAIISVGGFIAMNILRKVNPEFYGSILLFRRLFTLYIARRYIKNGILGLVKDHQANADTLTATAVAASVLAGKPESSLTLLALSNGAEMMTEYAAEVARDMDIDSYHAEILPEDKANYVMKMQKRGNVMMVGDGINDAPALAFADIGVSLGGNKTDIAAESAAITIRSEDPSKLYDALYIGRETMRAINQNFTATIVVNSAAMLLGALGKISPLWAAVIHNTATLAVVLNSVRILKPARTIRRSA